MESLLREFPFQTLALPGFVGLCVCMCSGTPFFILCGFMTYESEKQVVQTTSRLDTNRNTLLSGLENWDTLGKTTKSLGRPKKNHVQGPEEAT